MSYDQNSLTSKLQKAIDHVRQDLTQLRTGKANAALLDSVRVEAYGSLMQVHELASVSVPDATLIVITPWDKSILENLATGIQKANLGLNPVVDGAKIRLAVPALTQERRQEMVKLLGQKIESGKVLLRAIRIDQKKLIEEQKGNAGISEDDIENDLLEMDETIKKYHEKLEELYQHKQKELTSL